MGINSKRASNVLDPISHTKHAIPETGHLLKRKSLSVVFHRNLHRSLTETTPHRGLRGI